MSDRDSMVGFLAIIELFSVARKLINSIILKKNDHLEWRSILCILNL
ncbi:hypothetical protein M2277_000345 [Paenibacillus sp. LBL]|nr:hypothetical protein [Paenibacillus sp. LBL]